MSLDINQIESINRDRKHFIEAIGNCKGCVLDSYFTNPYSYEITVKISKTEAKKIVNRLFDEALECKNYERANYMISDMLPVWDRETDTYTLFI